MIERPKVSSQWAHTDSAYRFERNSGLRPRDFKEPALPRWTIRLAVVALILSAFVLALTVPADGRPDQQITHTKRK